ncbi:glycoside hydrolase family 18 protein [Xylariaceae sp. AK1471]|nr:glycoside hydrolase family 18 protein [Xylariaceae sp. AK1471]
MACNGNILTSGTIAQSGSVSFSGAIAKCQANSVNIILSLGGSTGSYSLKSVSEAGKTSSYLWEPYGNSGNKMLVQRPFSKAFVNGFDFTLEQNNGNQYYPNLITALRASFKLTLANEYYITGAPQCPIPEPNVGVIIGGSQFDYLLP